MEVKNWCCNCDLYSGKYGMLSHVNIFLSSLFLHVHTHQLVCSCICLPVYMFTPACVHITLLCTIPTGLRGSWVKNVMLYVQTSPDTMCLLTLFTYKVTPRNQDIYFTFTDINRWWLKRCFCRIPVFLTSSNPPMEKQD